MVSLIMMEDEEKLINPNAKSKIWSKIKSPTSGTQVESYLAQIVGGGGKRSSVLGMNLLDKVCVNRLNNAYEKKDLTGAFDRSIEESAKPLVRPGERLTETLKYIDVYKQGHTASIQDRYRDDPKFVYFRQCQDVDHDLVLPVLEHVHD